MLLRNGGRPGAARVRLWIFLWIVVHGVIAAAAASPEAPASEEVRAGAGAAEGARARIELHFFWSRYCPHCHDAIPFLEALARNRPWLQIRSFELSGSAEAGEHYRALAARFGEEARAVPGFIFCDSFLTGFDSPMGIGTEIVQRLDRCHAQMLREGRPTIEPGPLAWHGAAEAPRSVRVPLLGTLDPGQWSLPALTVVIGALDAFNPCAFFVLLFLLSIVVHARSRARILLIGGVFVAISGLLYFAFMAAWLNVFLVFEELPALTRIAGAVAALFALANIKDFFWFRRGVTLGIPEGARPGLFRRMRGLTTTTGLPMLIAGTVALAATVNLYEILCTLGLPMLYTRILSASEVGAAGYYGYLALYNVVYVLPMAAIVVLFAFTLGARKLQEREGRVLKLLSGMMMLGLAVVLLALPERMSDPVAVLGVVAGALLITGVIVGVERWCTRRGA